MSAPFKQGIDYFPHNTDLSQDLKLEYIEALHGLIGYAVYIKLLEKIYNNGYFIQWDKRDTLIFSKHNNIDVNVCINIVNDCINEGLFSEKLYKKYCILTSLGIQKRYLKCCERRKTIILVKEYLIITQKWVNENIKSVNVHINSKIVNNKKQNENENENENNTYSQKLKSVEKLFSFWNSLQIITHRTINGFTKHLIAKMDNYTEGEIKEAMNNYSKILKGKQYRFAYRWDLYKFLTQKNAFEKFLSINKPFENYLNNNSKQETPDYSNMP